MAEITTEDLRMRRFLLGELGEEEREELEQLVLAEDETRDRLLMAEDDLIEEYLEGSLQGDEREKFLLQFLSIPHQRDKLRVAKSLRRFARDEGNIDTVPIQPRVSSEANIDTEPIEPRHLSEADIDTVPIEPQHLPKPPVLSFYRNPLVYAPAAAILLVAIMLGAAWYVQYTSNKTRRQEIERELAQFNSSRDPNLPADQISSLIVLPFSPRSVVASSSSNFERQILELWLIPATRQNERYDALLQKVGSEDRFRIPNLQLQDRVPGEKAVRLRIPTHLLSPGTYRVQLSELSPKGTVANTSEYNFEIQ
jgi:hypothetical protein